MYEPITLKRLDDYAEILKEYKRLVIQKLRLQSRLGLSGVDYSAIKVTSGNSHKISEQEYWVMSLEKLNKKILEYRDWILPEQDILKTQIGRISKMHYRQLLILRYIFRFKWLRIIKEFFGFEEDFDEEKNLKYKDKIFDWNKAALAELEKVSAKPYVPIQRQMTIEETNNVDNQRNQPSGITEQRIIETE